MAWTKRQVAGRLKSDSLPLFGEVGLQQLPVAESGRGAKGENRGMRASGYVRAFAISNIVVVGGFIRPEHDAADFVARASFIGSRGGSRLPREKIRIRPRAGVAFIRATPPNNRTRHRRRPSEKTARRAQIAPRSPTITPARNFPAQKNKPSPAKAGVQIARMRDLIKKQIRPKPLAFRFQPTADSAAPQKAKTSRIRAIWIPAFAGKESFFSRRSSTA